jgi:Amt family ammonium transporter|tara:strand:+ start:12233 stop:13324 length:1092 start_codon:yes stop_codon:yes gene_type:complete
MIEVQYILSSFLLLVSGALVMWMACGFSMLEAGLVRARSVTSILKKNVLLYSVACIAFMIGGYSIMYGSIVDGNSSGAANFFFQVVFVATAASIISGTIAERMKLWPFIFFVGVLSLFIYPIQGSWTWGGGFLSEWGFSDFAGSTIVHSVGGWAALAGVILLGARKGRYEEGIVNHKDFEPSSLPLATLGMFILWFGWFGFNGGSQLAMASMTDINAISQVFTNTNIAAASGVIVAALLSQLVYKYVSLTLVLNGALAGLVSITAGPDYSTMPIAALIGGVGAALMIVAVPMFDRFKIDDPVSALSVHLVAGVWGTLAVGVFNPEVNILTQLQGIVIIGLFVFLSSLVVWFILKKTVGIRYDR